MRLFLVLALLSTSTLAAPAKTVAVLEFRSKLAEWYGD